MIVCVITNIYNIYEEVFQLNKERRIVMKKLIQLLVVLCIFVLTGCKTNKERYLSITTSGYDKKGNEVVNIYEYSLSTKKVTKSILLLIHLAFILSLIMLYIMLKKIIVAIICILTILIQRNLKVIWWFNRNESDYSYRE